MTFFSRPNLDDIQFKQLSGSTLTLDGQTIITAPSGLSLTGSYGTIPIIVTNEANNTILTYNNGQITLKPLSGSSGSGVYSGASPTTCAVGGLFASTPIAGCSLSQIIGLMVAPVLSPSLTPNYNTLSLFVGASPSPTIFEVGDQVIFTVCDVYNQGIVAPIYCGGTSVRTGLPKSYNYTDTGGGICSVLSNGLSNCTNLAQKTIVTGTNCVKSNVTYLAGIAPKKSDGNYMVGVTCASGTTSPSQQISVNGIYPYFWGISSSPPTVGQTLISNGNKVVADSTNDIAVTFNANGQYIWIATPSGSATKTRWEGSNIPATNTESIPGGLFNSPTTILINSPSSCWLNQNYKIYVSNYATNTYSSGTPYIITFKNS